MAMAQMIPEALGAEASALCAREWRTFGADFFEGQKWLLLAILCWTIYIYIIIYVYIYNYMYIYICIQNLIDIE